MTVASCIYNVQTLALPPGSGMGLFPNSHRRNGSSFHRLRSFHLAPGVEEGARPPLRSVFPTPSPTPSRSRSFFRFSKTSTTTVAKSVSISRPRLSRTWLVPRNASVPIPPGFIIALGVLLSLLFIVILACTFRGADAGEPPFKELLNTLARTSPGVSSQVGTGEWELNANLVSGCFDRR